MTPDSRSDATAKPRACTAPDAGSEETERRSPPRSRYVLDPSYVLLSLPPMEPITEHFPDQVSLGKAQRLDREAYEFPALPVSYSATTIKPTERDPERQPK